MDKTKLEKILDEEYDLPMAKFVGPIPLSNENDPEMELLRRTQHLQSTVFHLIG